MSEYAWMKKGITQKDGTQLESLTVLLAGGNGSRLGALTATQCKPALSFAGAYRNIDFTLSNCVNSGLRRIAVLTQYRAHSLLHHLTENWGMLSSKLGEFVELWPAQQRTDNNWYVGTANAVAQNIDLIQQHAPKYTVILAGDHIYKMDYRQLLSFHRQSGGVFTVGSVEVPVSQAGGFGVITAGFDNQIRDFSEKPCRPKSIPGNNGVSLVSMGIYVFNTDFLIQALQQDAINPSSQHDFGRDILPWAINRESTKVFAYKFHDSATGGPGYWRDVGTIDAYWSAHMDLLDKQPALDLHDVNWPIHGALETLPPARFTDGEHGQIGCARNSLISGGCVLEGGSVNRSLLATNVYIGAGTFIEDSVLLPGACVGGDCRLNKIIVGNNCVVPDGVLIGPHDGNKFKGLEVTGSGISVVTQETDFNSYSQQVYFHNSVA